MAAERSNREIEVIIDLDGTVHIEAIGFEGKTCEGAIDKIQRQLGELKNSRKKPEYYKKARQAERERD